MDDIVAGTLAWCNEKRAEKHLEPLPDLPKGKREDPTSCPCGAATGLYVENTGFYAESKEAFPAHAKELPPSVISFVTAFDQGGYPQYALEEDEPGGET